jgi:L-alanine-DL-glutamate epimerase-like enolase superfamily enzyme
MATTADQVVIDEIIPIESVEVAAYQVPTDLPESDGTIKWDSTTMVVAHVDAGGRQGFGFTYAPAAAARLIDELLISHLRNRDALNIEASWQAMVSAVRNAGLPGIACCAISAVDVALWDLKCKILQLPLMSLIGAVREEVEIYGSGGFTSYSKSQLQQQLGGWAEQGIARVKMKVGRDPHGDDQRVREARAAIGDHVDLFVDANGAYSRKQALGLARRFAEESGVVWFEEPRPSDDLAGLRLLRDYGPPFMDIAAGEYGYTPWYFRRMLEAGAVDCLQADATRCGGYTGFLKAAALCEAFEMPLSAHCAPQLHAHVACCAAPLLHVEYFHDHVRIAETLFDGVLEPVGGRLRPDLRRPGHGLSLKAADAEQYAVNF